MNSLENNFIISPKCGGSLNPEVKELEAGEGFESIQMSDQSNSLMGEGISRSLSRHGSHHASGSRRSLKPMKLILKSQQNLGLMLSDKIIDVDTSIVDRVRILLICVMLSKISDSEWLINVLRNYEYLEGYSNRIGSDKRSMS